ncbi:hypothetical protein BaRGS_00009649 [Batillaria attramentaria]|uniref:Uncharacterized protein n=1 Tax=Batillaria attramentaria TaxID=370345 RepID=A0ABD0LIF8_9CAEN
MDVDEKLQSSSSTGESKSSSPMASLLHKRLDLEADDVLDKHLTETTVHLVEDECQEPPIKRQRLSTQFDVHGDQDDSALSGSGPIPADPVSDHSLPNVMEGQSFDQLNESEENIDRVSTHEFEIIDEVVADEDGKEEEPDQDSEDSLEDSELYALLEEGITKDSITSSGKPIEREKVVLVERGHDPFDILPEGWLVVTHNSGMPVYLHRESRVCTLAQPYFLGSGSARKHDIPISAIPCLKYRRALDKEQQLCPEDQMLESVEEEGEIIEEASNSRTGLTNAFPSVKIKSADEMKKETSLDYMKVRDYCQKLFEFKTVTVQRYK